MSPRGPHMMCLIPVICVTVIIVGFASSSPSPTLKQVNLVFRHGARSPNLIFPSDINQLDAWPEGLGWLTKLGKQQQYALGKYLRQRYDGFINVTQYDHRQISVQSSAYDRCLMSVQANLAGMFPPQGEQIWNDELLWQPIPIHSVPKKQDNKIAIVAKCPRYHDLFTNLYKTKTAMDYQKNNQKFFDMLSNHTGWKEKSTFMNTWKTIDPLVSERAQNLTLNDWVMADGVLDKLDEIQHLSWSLLYHTAEMARLQGGPLLQEIIDNMNAANDGSSGDVKLYMYSGHDSTVSALLNAMTVSNKMQPPYCSLIMVELHNIDNQDVVKIFYRNDTESQPQYLIPEGCEDPCKLSTFQNVLATMIPKDWKAECQAVPNTASRYLPAGLPISLIILLTMLKLVVFN